MKIKLIGFRKSHMKSLVLTHPKGAPMYRWTKEDAIQEVNDIEFSHKILGSYYDMLRPAEVEELKSDQTTPPSTAPKVAQNSQQAAPSNKAVGRTATT